MTKDRQARATEVRRRDPAHEEVVNYGRAQGRNVSGKAEIFGRGGVENEPGITRVGDKITKIAIAGVGKPVHVRNSPMRVKISQNHDRGVETRQKSVEQKINRENRT